METLVVGAGAMGRWFGTALVEDGPPSTSVTFLDRNQATAEDAARAVGGEAVAPGAAPTVDLVCVAVPIPAATGAIERYADHAEAAIVDLTGTMAGPLAAMEVAAPESERASFHPLFAPANEPGNVPAVVDEGGPTVDAAVAALRARGNDVFETTANRHDELMETVQARTHTAVLAFALAAAPVPERYHTPVSAAMADLAAQVTDGDPRVYADIQSAFDGAADVAAAAAEIADADSAEVERLYEEAAENTAAGGEQ